MNDASVSAFSESFSVITLTDTAKTFQVSPDSRTGKDILFTIFLPVLPKFYWTESSERLFKGCKFKIISNLIRNLHRQSNQHR